MLCVGRWLHVIRFKEEEGDADWSGQLKTISKKIDAVEGKINREIKREIGAVEGKINREIKREIGAVEDKIGAVEDKILAQMSKMTSALETLAQQSQDRATLVATEVKVLD